MIVNVEADLRSGLHQLARAFRKNVAVLSDGVLVQERLGLLLAHVFLPHELFILRDFLNQVCEEMVHDRPRTGSRLGLDGLDVAIFGQAAIGDVVDPHIRTARWNDMRPGNFDDEIGLSDVPHIIVFERPGRRHVGHVALRRTLIDPSRDRRDFLVGQRRIVLELLNTDVALDVPWRHQARLRSSL